MKPLFDTQNCLVQPYYPIGWPYDDWIGDFPRRPRKDDEQIEQGWAELIERLQNPTTSTTSITYSTEQQVWFNNVDGGQTFRLEVVGYGREHISAEIKSNTLHISAKHGQKSFNQQYAIPSPENLDLNNAVSKVEHGLLEITFSAKKQEIKSIKLL